MTVTVRDKSENGENGFSERQQKCDEANHLPFIALTANAISFTADNIEDMTPAP